MHCRQMRDFSLGGSNSRTFVPLSTIKLIKCSQRAFHLAFLQNLFLPSSRIKLFRFLRFNLCLAADRLLAFPLNVWCFLGRYSVRSLIRWFNVQIWRSNPRFSELSFPAIKILSSLIWKTASGFLADRSYQMVITDIFNLLRWLLSSHDKYRSRLLISSIFTYHHDFFSFFQTTPGFSFFFRAIVPSAIPAYPSWYDLICTSSMIRSLVNTSSNMRTWMVTNGWLPIAFGNVLLQLTPSGLQDWDIGGMNKTFPFHVLH